MTTVATLAACPSWCAAHSDSDAGRVHLAAPLTFDVFSESLAESDQVVVIAQSYDWVDFEAQAVKREPVKVSVLDATHDELPHRPVFEFASVEQMRDFARGLLDLAERVDRPAT